MPTGPCRRIPSQRIQYGATVGGPIRQNRTHFFATYERDDRDTVSASTYTLPSLTAGRRTPPPSTLKFLADNNIDIARFGTGGTPAPGAP